MKINKLFIILIFAVLLFVTGCSDRSDSKNNSESSNSEKGSPGKITSDELSDLDDLGLTHDFIYGDNEIEFSEYNTDSNQKNYEVSYICDTSRKELTVNTEIYSLKKFDEIEVNGKKFKGEEINYRRKGDNDFYIIELETDDIICGKVKLLNQGIIVDTINIDDEYELNQYKKNIKAALYE